MLDLIDHFCLANPVVYAVFANFVDYNLCLDSVLRQPTQVSALEQDLDPMGHRELSVLSFSIIYIVALEPAWCTPSWSVVLISYNVHLG